MCSGETGHAEVVLAQFDLAQVSYHELLQHFFRLHDPTQLNRQGPDVGSQYRSVIYYYDEAQRQTAEAVIQQAQSAYAVPIVTEVAPAGKFYPAEDYHQKFTARTGRGMCHVEYAPL